MISILGPATKKATISVAFFLSTFYFLLSTLHHPT